MIPTLPENAEGGVKSTPSVHPNAPLPLFGTPIHSATLMVCDKTNPRIDYDYALYTDSGIYPLKHSV